MIPCILILARFSSRRLPGKALCDIAGRPLLGRVIDRMRQVRGHPAIVVATSEQPDDDAIAKFADEQGVAVFRGALNDVAGRCLAAAEAHGFDCLARVSGDSPFICPEIVGLAIDRFFRDGPDLETNVFPRSYPTGISIEVMATATLRRLLDATQADEDREHVTRYIYANPDQFVIDNFSALDDRYQGLQLTVDTVLDLQRARWICGQLAARAATAPLDDIAALARRWETEQLQCGQTSGQL